MQDFSASPREMVASFWRNRSLIYALSKREVVGRYRGSYFGILWSFINPMIMLCVYTFVFGIIFKAKWTEQSNSRIDFVLILFAGLLVFNIFSECINKSPAIIFAHANYVKKIIFPLEILPWVTLASALFHGAISLVIWLMAYSVLIHIPSPIVFWLPMIIFPLCLLLMGLMWILAALSVYLRDIGQVIGMAVTALMFTAPIFYPIESIPAEYQRWLFLNPLTYPVEEVRNYLFFERDPNFQGLLIYYFIALFISVLGFAWFQKMRKGFADVI